MDFPPVMIHEIAMFAGAYTTFMEEIVKVVQATGYTMEEIVKGMSPEELQETDAALRPLMMMWMDPEWLVRKKA